VRHAFNEHAPGSRVGGYRREVDYPKARACTPHCFRSCARHPHARWNPTYSDGLANVE